MKVVYERNLIDRTSCWGPILHDRHFEQWLLDFGVSSKDYILASIYDQAKFLQLPFSGYGHSEPIISSRSNIVVLHKFESLTIGFGFFNRDAYAAAWINKYRDEKCREGVFTVHYLYSNHTFRGTN